MAKNRGTIMISPDCEDYYAYSVSGDPAATFAANSQSWTTFLNMFDAFTDALPTLAPTATARLRWLCARSLDEVDAWEDSWRKMDARLDDPLGHFSWTRACLAVFGDEAEPNLVALARGDEMVAVAPLVKKRRNGVCRLFLAGVTELSEPMDLPWIDKRALARLVARLAHGGTPLVFERIAAESPSVRQLKRASRGRAIVLCRPQASCPFIALDETWLKPEAHLNSRRRGDLRRARRKADEYGPVSTEIHAPELDDLSHLLDTAFEVEASSSKGAQGTALLHDAHRAAFYRRYAEAACVEGTLRICFLRIGDRVAAAQVAIEQDESFWLLTAGHDVRYAGCSPGLLLMSDTISYAAEAGLKSYEFLGRAEEWTRIWTETERKTVSLCVYPFGLRGLAALVADAAVAAYERRSAK
jgi:CelD/BcsL family acetyltransferase involved in cellulose biosynthesis